MTISLQYRIIVILLITNLCLQTTGNAQKCYRAIYKYNIPNNFVTVSKVFADTVYNQHDGRIRFKSNLDSIVTKNDYTHDSVQQIHNRELYKFLHNNLHFVCESCPDSKFYYPAPNIGERSHFLPDSNTNVSFTARSHSYTFVNMKDYMVTVARQDAIDDVTVVNSHYKRDTVCYILDTAKLHFARTGKAMQIANRNCIEYRPINDDKHKLSVWSSNEIPYYITPMIFGLGIQGGIVEVRFDNGNYISLVNIVDIDEQKSIDAPCHNDSDFPYFMPLRNILGELD